MRARNLSALLAIGLLSACATPMPPSTPPMPPMQRPDACRVACSTLPRLAATDEISVTVWMHEVIYAAGECRRLHDACRRFDAGR